MESQDGGLEPRAMYLNGAIKKYHDFIRFVGLNKIHTNMSFASVVEIVWRQRLLRVGLRHRSRACSIKACLWKDGT